MSMPSFPVISPPISKEEALNLILASIAMEEMGLSHIINAEGEKLQYVLGTLDSKNCLSPDIDQIIQVNKSINSMLSRVTDNQIILKSKMERVLDSMEQETRRYPVSPIGRDCVSIFKLGEDDDSRRQCCRCGNCGCGCGDDFIVWQRETALPLKAEFNGCNLKHMDNAVILPKNKRFLVSYSITTISPSCCNNAIDLLLCSGCESEVVSTFYIPQCECGNTASTISSGEIFIDRQCEKSKIGLILDSQCCIKVKDATIVIREID